MGDRLRRTNHLSISPSHPGQLGGALRLGSKSRYGSFQLWISVWVAGKTVRSLVNTCHIWALYLEMSPEKALYKSTFTLLQVASWSIQPFGHNTLTLQTDRQDRQDRTGQRDGSIGRTVTCNDRPKTTCPKLCYLWPWLDPSLTSCTSGFVDDVHVLT